MTLDRSLKALMLSSALALVLTGPVLAQTTTPPAEEQQPPAATQDMQAPAPGTDSGTMGTDQPTGSTATDSMTPPAGSTATDSVTPPAADTAEALPPKPTEPILMTQEDGQVLSDEVIGTDVRNSQDESIGAIEELLLDEHDRVIAAIVSVGGFLGIGAKDVAVNWSEIRFSPEEEVAVVMLTREDLESAPAFEDRAQQQAAAEKVQNENQPQTQPATPPATAPATD